MESLGAIRRAVRGAGAGVGRNPEEAARGTGASIRGMPRGYRIRLELGDDGEQVPVLTPDRCVRCCVAIERGHGRWRTETTWDSDDGELLKLGPFTRSTLALEFPMCSLCFEPVRLGHRVQPDWADPVVITKVRREPRVELVFASARFAHEFLVANPSRAHAVPFGRETRERLRDAAEAEAAGSRRRELALADATRRVMTPAVCGGCGAACGHRTADEPYSCVLCGWSSAGTR